MILEVKLTMVYGYLSHLVLYGFVHNPCGKIFGIFMLKLILLVLKR